jgi:hypothetical protein
MSKNYFYKSFTGIFVFIFIFSFVNLQTVNAYNFLDYFFNSQNLNSNNQNGQINNSDQSAFTSVVAKILILTGFANIKTQQIQAITQNPIPVTTVGFNEDMARKNPICNSSNQLYFDQPTCNNLIAQGRQLDNSLAQNNLLSLQAKNNSICDINSLSYNSIQCSNQNDSNIISKSQQVAQPTINPAYANDPSIHDSEFVPTQAVVGNNTIGQSSTGVDNQAGIDNSGQIPSGLDNVVITPACESNFADLGSGCSSKSGLKPIVILSLKQACSVLGKPVPLTSAYRSETCNSGVGGAPKSQHKSGLAVDIVPSQIGDYAKQLRVFLIFKKNGAKGVGCYSSNKIHLDFRSSPAKWGRSYHSDTFNTSNCPAALVQAFKDL